MAFCTAGLFAACASGSDETGSGVGGFGGSTSTTSGMQPTSSGIGGSTSSAPDTSSTSSGMGCAPQCNIDADCQNSCEAPTSGIYCCDTMNSMCYLSPQSMCPSTTGTGPGSGSSSSGY